MCIVSDEIKFCSCNSDINSIKHAWILYHKDDNKNLMTMGMILFNEDFNPHFEANCATILKRLNEEDAFDFPAEFKNKDVLVVNINNKETKKLKTETYTFQFENDKWVIFEEAPFELDNFFSINKHGKIESATKPV